MLFAHFFHNFYLIIAWIKGPYRYLCSLLLIVCFVAFWFLYGYMSVAQMINYLRSETARLHSTCARVAAINKEYSVVMSKITQLQQLLESEQREILQWPLLYISDLAYKANLCAVDCTSKKSMRTDHAQAKLDELQLHATGTLDQMSSFVHLVQSNNNQLICSRVHINHQQAAEYDFQCAVNCVNSSK